MITLDTPAETKDSLYEQAKALDVPGRSKMTKGELFTAVADAIKDRQQVLAKERDTEIITHPDAANVIDENTVCPDIFGVATAVQPTPATVFGGRPRSKFKVTRTSTRRRNVRNRHRNG
ncbi:MAG TPA: Rho termination factor N-terminal domain-containing protein [Nitrospira sp.]|nr:Rho termination factor N-terminal domain-containing protein [Nitrospira sp.]